MDVKIERGVEWRDDLRTVAPDLWPDLIAEYRFFCQRALPTDCRSLLRMVSEGEHVGWAGYSDRATYLRDGLGLDPQAAEWAITGLGIAGVEIPIEYAKAQKLGWGGARARAGRKFKNDNASHYNQDDLNVIYPKATKPLAGLRLWWQRASRDDRATFLAEIDPP